MQSTHLSLVPLVYRDASFSAESVRGARSADRKLFWRLYLDWMALASIDETEQLEVALSPHAHHVRPLIEALSDAMRCDSSNVPASLLAALSAGGWSPLPLPATRTAA